MKISDFINAGGQRILDNIKCGVLLLNSDLEILYVNQEYEEITGLSCAEILGKTSGYMVRSGMVSFSIAEEVRQSLQASTKTQTFSNNKIVLVSGRPILDGGELQAVVITVKDTSDESRLYGKLKEAEQIKTMYQHSFEQVLTKDIVASGQVMRQVISAALQAAKSSSSVLLSGETGVGKDVIANLIHNASTRSRRPLIRLNCAAIPHDLAEAEFFGYVEGAFTGARRGGAPGIFELADQSTVFMDEVEELSLAIQSKLLRTLQDHEVTRIGGHSNSKKLDFRVISATNQPLMQLINEGKFRQDFYYRINVISITIPPLRDHLEDIEPLVSAKMDKLVAKYHITKIYSQDAIAFLQRYYWPGNVRELENIIERLYFSTESHCIEKHDVMQAIEINQYEKYGTHREYLSMKEQLQNNEISILHEAVRQFRTMREAALHLGIDPATMTRKCKQYNIKR